MAEEHPPSPMREVVFLSRRGLRVFARNDGFGFILVFSCQNYGKIRHYQL